MPVDHADVEKHIEKVLEFLALSQPASAFQNFQLISHNIRHSKPEDSSCRIRQQFKSLEQSFTVQKSLLAKLTGGSEEEPTQPGVLAYVPNFMEECRVMEQAGIGFGEDATYKLFKSRFVQKRNPKQVKFWGKVLGTGKDYYVLEGLADGGQEEPNPEAEPKGVGVNSLTYWVATDLAGEWSELPSVTPTQVKISRKIKHLLTGTLEAKVMSNPFFPGKEKHLLKCIVARVTASTTIIPKGIYVPNQEDPKQIDLVEEFKLPGTDKLTTLDSWVHHPVSILKNGRISLIKPEIENPDDEARIMKELEARDPSEPRLKPISKDKEAWRIKVYGELAARNLLTKEGQWFQAVIAIRSLVWPGAATLFYQGKWFSVYTGYGFKANSLYCPSIPETVLVEKGDRDGYQEPNGPVEE